MLILKSNKSYMAAVFQNCKSPFLDVFDIEIEGKQRKTQTKTKCEWLSEWKKKGEIECVCARACESERVHIWADTKVSEYCVQLTNFYYSRSSVSAIDWSQSSCVYQTPRTHNVLYKSGLSFTDNLQNYLRIL